MSNGAHSHDKEAIRLAWKPFPLQSHNRQPSRGALRAESDEAGQEHAVHGAASLALETGLVDAPIAAAHAVRVRVIRSQHVSTEE